jgi:hypothetical protein
LGIRASAALAVFDPEAVAVHLEDVNMVGETIEQRAQDKQFRGIARFSSVEKASVLTSGGETWQTQS